MKKEDDILRVKKNADQGYRFHYDRRERLSMLSAPKSNNKSRGLLRGNRSLLILLLDILLICIIVVILNLFDLGSTERRQVSGYSFHLRAFPYEDVVLVTLAVKKTSDETDIREDPISVRFLLDEISTDNSVLLPKTLDEEVMIRDSLKIVGEKKVIKAEITFDAKTYTLSRKLEWD